MTERKFASISSGGSAEDGYCLIAVADDGSAWTSDVMPSLGGIPLDDINWHPVGKLPSQADVPYSWAGFK